MPRSRALASPGMARACVCLLARPSSPWRWPHSPQRHLIEVLDGVAASCTADIAARALAVQAELLWAIAGWGGRHGTGRAGPAWHPDWRAALHMLATHRHGCAPTTGEEGANLRAAVELLAARRDEVRDTVCQSSVPRRVYLCICVSGITLMCFAFGYGVLWHAVVCRRLAPCWTSSTSLQPCLSHPRRWLHVCPAVWTTRALGGDTCTA